MKYLGQKSSTQSKGLGVKHNSLVKGLGNKNPTIPHLISNIISPNKPNLKITGIGISNLIPNSSNSSNLQYLPTNLEKRKRA